jgi:WD40 repeat protein
MSDANRPFVKLPTPPAVVVLLVAIVMASVASTACGQKSGARRISDSISVVSGIERFAVSPDGKIVAVVTLDKTIAFFDADTGKKMSETPRIDFDEAVFSPDLRFVAFKTEFSTSIQIWDVRAGSEYTTFKLDKKAPRCLLFSPDSKLLAIATGNEAILWNLESKEPQKTFRLPNERHDVYSLLFLPDGKRLVTGGHSFDGTARVWDVDSGKELQSFTGHGDVSYLACSADGTQLVTLSEGVVRLFDLRTGGEIKRGRVHQSGPIRFTPNGEYIAIGHNAVGQEFLEPKTLAPISFREIMERKKVFPSDEDRLDPYYAIGFSPNGSWLAFDQGSGGASRKISFWSKWSKSLGVLPVTSTASLPELTFSDDCQRLFFRQSDSDLAVIDCEAFAENVESQLRTREERSRLAAAERAAEAAAREQKQKAEVAAAHAKKAAEAHHETVLAENSKPKWEGFEDLNALMKGCGAFENAPLEQELAEFVRYGSPANAAKARKGDRFDKEDAKEAAKEHLAGLAKRNFFLRIGQYSWNEEESSINVVVLWAPSPGFRAATKPIGIAVAHDFRTAGRCFTPQQPGRDRLRTDLVICT